ncbi:MAG: type I glyceraldehyde-3-phosphate dehydrogenase [Holophaga sp.]|nr:type I glyceraldehyde-3-phosphate dehydrogenase [Holophaga sp.]
MQVAVNGLGRIGRQLIRQLQHSPELELVAVNDLAEPATVAHLIKYDSVHGRAGFRVGCDRDALLLAERRVPLFREPDPARLEFGALGAELVLECTGRFTTRDQAARHLHHGVTRVVVGAPMADADLTVVMGVNPERLQGAPPVISAACATTHALAILLRVMDQAFGVRGGVATAVESYGNDQRILDLPHPDQRMARAAALSMIPAPSDAAACLGRVLPALAGRLAVQAVRVPTPDVSLADLCVTLERDATQESVLAAFRAAAARLPGILELLDEPLVSVDLRGMEASCLLDPFLTRIMAPRFVKVFGWYDNETAYAARLKDLCVRLSGANQ